ncbi:MAG: mechanosensitive ion channel [Saprospirales bacterium]|nr:mechanosensitive ion channel [Saprospirales bacterium]MBK8920127.1 mechanosensitive ion channel [Saprospirales bacterium]
MEEFLNYTLFRLGAYTISVYHLVLIGLLALTTWVSLFLLRTAIYRSKRIDTGRKYAIYQIIRYFLLVIVIAIGLETMGVSLTVLMAGSAALLVGIGLGLQNLFNDFVSGIILLADGSVEVNDVVEVDGMVARVLEINLRTSVVQTRDDKYIILPNSMLTGGKLINWTHNSELSRFEITVGVAYASDVNKVMEILVKTAREHPQVSAEREPFVRLLRFGEFSIDFELLFWTKDVFRVDNTKSDIRIAICQAFREHGVEIPFPQRVVHITPA